jgi:hypothetical protein
MRRRHRFSKRRQFESEQDNRSTFNRDNRRNVSDPASSQGTNPAPVNNQLALSFAVCVSDREVLKTNLLSSPCFKSGSAHEVIAIENCPSAADGLNLGLERAMHEWVVCVHQDVYLPDGWDWLLARQPGDAERLFGPIGVAGVYGVGEVIPPQAPGTPQAAQRIGWVLDRGRLLRDGPGLPAQVATLDELLLVLPRSTPLRFDPGLGFHLYGADLCLQARERGPAVVALGALCHHNSRSVELPGAFFPSAAVFARKSGHMLPIATPCVIVERDARVHLLGNATERPRSIAYALPAHGPSRILTADHTENGRFPPSILHAR